MSRRYAQKLILWLLPLMVLRSLVPAGYMLDVRDGALSVVVCDGFSRTSSEHDIHAEHQHHAQAGGNTFSDVEDRHAGHGSTHAKHSVSICPFAIAGSAAVTPTLPFLLLSVTPPSDVQQSTELARFGRSGPSRAQTSRGPPHLS